MTNDSGQSRAYSAAHFMFELDGVDKLGMFRSIEGGGLKAEVMTYQNGGTYDRWRQLGKPKFEDIKLQVGMAMSEPFFKWIAEFFSGKPSRKNGAIIAADFDYKERARREFTEAMITELTRCRNSSFDRILIFHCADCALCTEFASGGPNIISDGHHQRLSASCAIAFCSGVPWQSLIMMSKPCRWWKLSSLQTRIIAREYGPNEQRQSGI